MGVAFPPQTPLAYASSTESGGSTFLVGATWSSSGNEPLKIYPRTAPSESRLTSSGSNQPKPHWTCGIHRESRWEKQSNPDLIGPKHFMDMNPENPGSCSDTIPRLSILASFDQKPNNEASRIPAYLFEAMAGYRVERRGLPAVQSRHLRTPAILLNSIKNGFLPLAWRVSVPWLRGHRPDAGSGLLSTFSLILFALEAHRELVEIHPQIAD